MSSHDATRRRAVPLPRGIKEALRHRPVVESLWTAYRRRQALTEYRARREHYARQAAERGLVYSEESTRALARQRIAARGYTPAPRKSGQIHTFACFSSYGWHDHLLPDLRELGEVSRFDYQTLGIAAEELARMDRPAAEKRDAVNAQILPAIRAAHARRPIDWIFFYGGGHEYTADTVRRITDEIGVPVVNMSLDDKQGWSAAMGDGGGCRAGAIDITSSFDLFATSAQVACEWHLVEGGRPLYMPEGFDAGAYRPRDVPRDLPVSFVGVAYGFRHDVNVYLRKHGVDFRPFGAGWPAGRATDMVEIFNRSVINLGMGGVEYSEELTNVKGRDFEVPGTGGGVYLTSYNADLARHFIIGEEILCYRGRDEMLELIRHYLARPDEAREIARRARQRSLREHRWLHRYQTMLRMVGILG